MNPPGKITIITPSVGKGGGGLQGSICGFSTALAAQGCDIHVIAPRTEDSIEALPQWNKVPLDLIDINWCGKPLRWGRISQALDQTAPDLVHFNSLWLPLSRVSHHWCRLHHKPYLITPHGTLDPQALQQSGWKKRIALALYERAHLRDAACLHALCDSEWQSIEAFGLNNPVCIIPNGIDIPDKESGLHSPPPWGNTFPRDRKILLFLGRIHPKKGISLLIEAWAKAKRRLPSFARQWGLVIGGWDQLGHRAQLEKQAQGLGVDEDILFAGPLFGESKASALRHCDAFVLSSLSEGLPMSVLEAWSYGKLALISPACNIPEGFAANAALKVELNPNDIAQQLCALADMSENERADMGRNALRLVREKFTWEHIADELKQVYSWIVGGGAAPACVQLPRNRLFR